MWKFLCDKSMNTSGSHRYVWNQVYMITFETSAFILVNFKVFCSTRLRARPSDITGWRHKLVIETTKLNERTVISKSLSTSGSASMWEIWYRNRLGTHNLKCMKIVKFQTSKPGGGGLCLLQRVNKKTSYFKALCGVQSYFKFV